MKKLIIALFILLLPVVSWAAIDCDRTTLANAISAASDGDTITCNAGTWTYTTGISISNKGLIIEGAGTGSTTLKAGATSLMMFNISLQAGDPTFEIRDITFDLDGQDNGSNGLITLYGGGLNAFWIHDCAFDDQYGTVITFNMSGLRSSGLVSNQISVCVKLSAFEKSAGLITGSNAITDRHISCKVSGSALRTWCARSS